MICAYWTAYRKYLRLGGNWFVSRAVSDTLLLFTVFVLTQEFCAVGWTGCNSHFQSSVTVRDNTWHYMPLYVTLHDIVCDGTQQHMTQYVTQYVTVRDRTRHSAWRYCHLTRSPQSKCGTVWSFLKPCSWTKRRWRQICISVWICWGCWAVGAERLEFVFRTVNEFVKLSIRTKVLL